VLYGKCCALVSLSFSSRPSGRNYPLKGEQKMKSNTTTTPATQAVTTGVVWMKAKENLQASLWLFGESLHKAIGEMEKEGATKVRTQIAKAILKECHKPINDGSLKTMQNKISSALKCFRDFKDVEAVVYFTMRELGGAKKKPAKKKGKFNAVEEAGNYTHLSSVDKKAFIAALIAIS